MIISLDHTAPIGVMLNVGERVVGLDFEPGLNSNIDKSLWEKAKDLDGIQGFVESGMLMVISGNQGDLLEAIPTLKGFSDKATDRLISECLDLDVLQAWLLSEKSKKPRPHIISALEEQMVRARALNG